jgi:hypothetical protein
MTVAYVMQTLAEASRSASIVVEEAPSSRAAMQAHLPFVRSETFYTMDSGGLGYSMPAAVGIALAKPHAKISRTDRRRFGHVLDPGAVDRGTARTADHVRHPQESALRRDCRTSRRRSASAPASGCPAPSCPISISLRWRVARDAPVQA